MDFEVETKYTLEEYRRFNKVVTNVLQGSCKKTIIACVLAAILDVVLIFMQQYKQALFFGVFWVLFVVILYIRMNQNIDKAWKSNALMQDTINRYHFMDDRLEITSATGEEMVEYSKLHRVIETKTNFYIMIANNMGYIVARDACTPEQQSHISGLAG
ncbi:MAG: YcxB family protein [Lachnospiraceae bacterium]|nr:YcxB family protein [Lachnospiraceae bacterium]